MQVTASVPDHELHNGVFRSISSDCMRPKIFLFFLPNFPALCNIISHKTLFPHAHSGLCKWRLESLSTVESRRFSAIVEFSQEQVGVKHPAWKMYLHSGRSGRSSSGSWPTHRYFFLPSLTCNHIFQVHLSTCHTEWCIALKKAKQVITFPQSSAVERSDLIWSWGAMKWHRKCKKIECSHAGREAGLLVPWNNQQHRHTIHLCTGSLFLTGLWFGTWLHSHGRYIFGKMWIRQVNNFLLCGLQPPVVAAQALHRATDIQHPPDPWDPPQKIGLFQAFMMEKIFFLNPTLPMAGELLRVVHTVLQLLI